MKLRKKAKSGFTLVEVIISMVLIVIVLIPVVNMLVASTKTQHKAKEKQEATEIGQSKLEELCANSSISLTGNTFTDIDGNVFNMTEVSPGNWESAPTTIDGYSMKFLLTRGKIDTATSTVISYTNNQTETDEVNNLNNYCDVLTFNNASISYDVDTNKVCQGQISDSNINYVNLDVYGDDTSGIQYYKIKTSTGQQYTVSIDPSKQHLKKIEIVQGKNFGYSSSVTVNIASQLDIDVDFIRQAVSTNEIILNNAATESLKGTISTTQLGAAETIDVADELYTIQVLVCDPKHIDWDNPTFSSRETRNIKIN